MNRWIPLLLALVLLTGCAAQNPQPQPTEVPIPTPAEIPAPFGFRDVGNALETQSFGALQVFPLPEEAAGFLPLGDGILLFSAREAGTELTLLTGESLVPTESISLSFVLTSRNSTLTYCSEGISFFDDQAMQTVILDHTLQELRRIKVPDNLTGMPILSHDGSILYYCTASAVRALDLHTGISRIIKETAYPMQSVSGLFLEDSILLLSITDQNNAFRTLFLSTPTGLQLAEYDGVLTLATCGANYYTKVYSGASEILMFGQADNAPQVLLPNNAENTFFLEPLHGAVTITPSVNAHTTLEYYDLSNGVRTAALTLEETLYPEEVHAAADGSIWFLAKNGNDESIALYRWQPERSAVQDTQLYTAAYYTRQNPDYDGLAACTLYAQEISARHGVDVLVYEDATVLQPWDYTFEAEYMAPVLRKELELLDARLSHYPDGFLRMLAETFSGIKICIVQQIRGTPESGNMNPADGIQFWNGYEAYIALATGHDTERILYHELCHLIDTLVLTESTAYDGWESLNPAGFVYANSANHTLDADNWCQAGWESFLDDDSMGYPKEDRARIMEYAMAAGNADRFESPYLQAKLKLLCTGIREAFNLEKWTESLLWEQYLHTPLTPGK